MPQIIVSKVIGSEKAKTIEHALAVIQQVRTMGDITDELQLNFSNITWVTSMFVDRLVKALVTFFGSDFEQKVRCVCIEETNVMFNTLWESAISKVLDLHDPFA